MRGKRAVRFGVYPTQVLSLKGGILCILNRHYINRRQIICIDKIDSTDNTITITFNPTTAGALTGVVVTVGGITIPTQILEGVMYD